MINYTIFEFQNVKNNFEIDTILKNLKPVNLFAGKSLNENTITYLELKNIFKIIKNGTTFDHIFEMFNIAFGVVRYEFDSALITDYYAARNYIIDFCKKTIDKEQKLMKSISADNHLWDLAGGKSLNAFSDLMPLVKLGEIYGCYPYDLQNKPYSEILTLLVLHKRKADVEIKFSKLKK